LKPLFAAEETEFTEIDRKGISFALGSVNSVSSVASLSGELKLITIKQEPKVAVGLMSGIEELRFDLNGEFIAQDGRRFAAGSYRAHATAGTIEIMDTAERSSGATAEFVLIPGDRSSGSFTLRGVTIGIDFHWQRKEDQRFQDALHLKLGASGHLIVINEIAVERYLTSVISSEMSATSHPELLKAHAIISRSWLLAQLKPWKVERRESGSAQRQGDAVTGRGGEVRELIRWYDRENHADFDVCADDHCQRYQGITKATAPAVFEAIRATRGEVLIYDGALCDARFSKSCGGMTEEYRAAWEDASLPYLTARYDGETFPSDFALPLNDEANAVRWIFGSPSAFCHTNDQTVLQRILPDFDQETVDFYRWRVQLEQAELQALLCAKLGIEFGPILKLEPVERGASGRIVRLQITGERESLILGKELEIRRAFSTSHLYSSAFVVQAEGQNARVSPRFTLLGAGWGHGVGLCQIGAAIMAERGYQSSEILKHYYTGASLHKLYEGES
jgi:SpoIID/LytB domain protein